MLKTILARLLSGLMAAIMPAFDGIILRKLKPGVSTAQDVRNRMGPPTMEWVDAGGQRTWEYSRTPYGIVNYMIDFGPDEQLREIRQVLCEEYFARVKDGMTREQIRRLLGRPANTYHFPLKKEHVWDWKSPGTSCGEEFFNVHFNEDGYVVRTSKNFAHRH